MTPTAEGPVRGLDDVVRFESERTLQDRLPGRGILDVFLHHAVTQPDRTAITMLVSGAEDEQPCRVSYGELLGLVRQAANAFHALAGPRPGVAYLLPNLVQTHVSLWAAMAAGYAVPINFLLGPEHVAELVKASGASVLVALGPHPTLDIWSTALAVQAKVPGLSLVSVGPPGLTGVDGVPDVSSFDALLADQPADRLVFDRPGQSDDLAAYLHTGGTTGNPKLVTLTHRSLLAAALGGAVLADMRRSDVLTASLPLFHAGGTVFCGLSMLLAGAELLVMSPAALRNPAMVKSFWRLSAQYGATLVGAVPTGLAAVLDVPIGDADLSGVRAGFTGASSIPPSVGQRFRDLTGRHLCEVYGMTECSGLISLDPVGGPGAPGSVGIRLPYTDVAVRRLSRDRAAVDGPSEVGPAGLGGICAPGEIGAIVVRGPHVSPGYRNPDHDAGVFENGALITGDLGYTDSAGNLYVAGRVKDLIIRSGHNIDPMMIENAMTEHPAVALAAAVGMPDDYAGEVPVCYVSMQPGATASVDQLEEHARRTIGERPAWPRQIHVVDAIPLTAVGKIFKPALRIDSLRQLVGRLLTDELAIPQAQVRVQEGGPRGMRVDIDLPPGAHSRRDDVHAALSPYLFEVHVHLAKWEPPELYTAEDIRDT